MTDVLALDVATTTGWARGKVGDAQPTAGSHRFAASGSSQNAILYRCREWIGAMLDERRPDIIALESLLPTSFVRGRTTKATNELLCGLHGVIRAEAFARGIYKINAFPANAIRGHFIDMNICPRGQAKRYVLERCRSLGWLPASSDDNAADACATWSYQIGRLDPEHSIRISPLFQKRRVA